MKKIVRVLLALACISTASMDAMLARAAKAKQLVQSALLKTDCMQYPQRMLTHTRARNPKKYAQRVHQQHKCDSQASLAKMRDRHAIHQRIRQLDKEAEAQRRVYEKEFERLSKGE